MNHYLERSITTTPDTIIIGSFHTKRVSAGRDIGVSSLMTSADIVPILVESLQEISILIFLRRAITEGSKRQAEHIVLIRQIYLRDMLQSLWENIRAHLNRLIIQLQSRDKDGRFRLIDMNLIRIESIESAHGTEEELTIGRLEHGIRLELFAHQSILTIIQLNRLARNITHQSLRRR